MHRVFPRAALLLLLLLPLLFIAGPPGAGYLAAGDEAAARGAYEQALASYAQAAAVEPWRPAPHLRTGDLALRLGRAAEAKEAYERALAIAPAGAAYLGLARAQAIADDARGAARAYLAYAQLRGDPAAAYAAGRLFLEASAAADAEAALTLATESAAASREAAVAVAARLLLASLVGGDRPAAAERYLLAAREAASPGLEPRVDAALSLFRLALQAGESAGRATWLGRLALATGAPALAEAYCRQAAAADPPGAEAHACLALALLARGQAEAAAASAEQAAALQGDDPLARYARAAALRAAGDLRPAMAELRELLAANPSDPSFVYELASAYADFGDYQAAARLVAAAADGAGDDPALLLAAARFHLDRAFRPTDALPWTQRVVELRPDDPEAWAAHGWALHLAGRHADGAAALARSLAIDPLSPGAHYHLGLAYEKQGMVDMAREHYLRAADLDPTGPDGRRARRALSVR